MTIGRLDPILLCAMAAACGCGLVLAPWPTAAAAVGAVVVLVAARPRADRDARGPARLGALVALAAALFGLSALRSAALLRAASARYAATLGQLPAPALCAFRARVASSPVVLERGTGPRPSGADAGARARAPSTGRSRVDVDVLGGECTLALRPDPGAADAHAEAEPGDSVIALTAPLRARLYAAPDDAERGDELELTAQLAPVHLFWNPGLADPRTSLHGTGVTASGTVLDAHAVEGARAGGVAALVDRARHAVRGRIQATFAPGVEPLARALVLGETDLDPADSEAFRESGLSHLLAVSGTHLVLVVLAVERALRALAARIPALAARFDVGRATAALCVPLAWLYADFAGGSGSARRAAAMMTAAMLARALGGRPSGVRAFAWSLAGAALVDPLAMCDASFALSVGATAGLLLGAHASRDWLAGTPRPLRALARLFAATLFATAGCAPFVLVLAPGIPVLGVAANVLAAPVGELAALPLCLVHALLGWWPAAEAGVALVAGGALHAVRAVAQAGASVPVLPVPPPTAPELAVLALGVTAALAVAAPARRLVALVTVLALGACELAARHDARTEGLLGVTALDVGQGDSLLVDLPDGRLMLVDGGGFVGSPVDVGERVILPVLRSRRRARIDIAVLTHPHPDHYGGLLRALDAVPVGELWHNGQVSVPGEGALAALFARLAARGTRLRSPRELCGAVARFGEATVEALAPCPGPEPELGANDNSLVLRIALGRRVALLVGDAEHERERRLLDAYPAARLRADVLKVGHHGSRTSTGADLLATVAPGLALVSCGVRNRFGHPYPTTLDALSSAGVAVRRTDRGGAITWQTDGERVRVSQPGVAEQEAVAAEPP